MTSLYYYMRIRNKKNTQLFYWCKYNIDLPWDTYIVSKGQPRYSSVTQCKYYPILGQPNDWVIMDFIDEGTYDNEYESVQKNVLEVF